MLARAYVDVGRCDEGIREQHRSVEINEQWNDAMERQFAYDDLARL